MSRFGDNDNDGLLISLPILLSCRTACQANPVCGECIHGSKNSQLDDKTRDSTGENNMYCHYIKNDTVNIPSKSRDTKLTRGKPMDVIINYFE
jgi:hypothetical protein